MLRMSIFSRRLELGLGFFLDFDETTIERKSLDFARIQISTSRKGLIDETVRLRVMGAVFELWVVEEREHRWRPKEEVRLGWDEVSSRETDMAGCDEVGFSADDGSSPRSYTSVQLGLEGEKSNGKVGRESEVFLDVQNA
jgi:hypothetical protein